MKNEEKIACSVCKAEIPKSAALTSEGEGYVQYYCSIGCLEHYKKEEKKKKENKG